MIRRRHRHQERGVTIIWVALFLMLFLVFIGWSLDTLFLVLTSQQLQAGADATALTGVQKVQSDPAQARVDGINIASLNSAAGDAILLADNPGNDPNGDVVIGVFNTATGQFTATFDNPNAFKAVARRTDDALGGPVPLFFGPIFGIDTVNVERTAIGLVANAAAGALVVLDPTRHCALDLDSNARIDITTGGAVQVNSYDYQAGCFDSNALIDADYLNVVGDVIFRSNSELTGQLNTGTSSVGDPLANLPEPAYDAGNDLGSIDLDSNQITTINAPGYYSNGISLDSNSELTLGEGIYILGGNGLRLKSNSFIVGSGVMFFLVDGATIDMDSNSYIDATPPDPDVHSFPEAETYQRILIFQARDNANAFNVTNSNSWIRTGTLYLPNSTLHMDSNARIDSDRVIVNQLHMDSNSVLSITTNLTDQGPKTVFLVH